MSAVFEFPPRITPWRQTYRQLLRVAGAHATALRASLIGLVLAAVAQGLALASVVPLFTSMQSAPNGGNVLTWLVIMSLLMALATLLRWRAQNFEFNGELAAATHALRTRLGEQLRRMPLERLRDKRTGEMTELLLGNVDENLNYTLMIIDLIVVAVLTPLVTALALLAVDWRLGLALMLIFPAIIPLYRWRRPAFGRDKRTLAEAHARTSADILEYTQGLPALRASCGAGEKAERLHAGFEALERIQTVGHRKSAKPNRVVSGVVEVGLLLILASGVVWVTTSTLDVATLAAVFVIVARFSEPLSTFVMYTAILELIEAALERIEELLAVPSLSLLLPAAVPNGYEVRFENVTFRYAQASSASLCDFSALFPAQGFTALVGRSGSGKTTLTRLLLRHADPLVGRVTVGGVDVRAIPPDELNAMISVVFQDVYLFDDTVLANIRMARPNASDAEVEAAARAAQCLDFITHLPLGWHTRLGDIGGRLSGGERQRISIARALLKDAPIVILDEPTAALDTESEVAVQRAINALVRNRTVIVIAHRLSTIACADRILVVEDGRLVEQGRHDDLLARAGRYRDLWEAQRAVKAWRAGVADADIRD
jgi:ATP-binding cassette, subfamily B, bacterial IrtB/YbtQ